MLSAYQVVLCKDMTTIPDPTVWEEFTVVKDIYHTVQLC